MTRILQPELLDTLPAEDSEATRSRADLRRVNWWMGHRRILLHALRNLPISKAGRIVELGAGDGTLALKLASRLSGRWKNVELILVDQQRLVTAETLEGFRRLGWNIRVVQADVFQWLADESEPADIVFTNLFLHHFEEAGLRRLLGPVAARCSNFIALEPQRHFLARVGCELLWMIGCNRVTRHDARLSVRAGFRGTELSPLWPSNREWVLREESAGPFSHLFVASRGPL